MAGSSKQSQHTNFDVYLQWGHQENALGRREHRRLHKSVLGGGGVEGPSVRTIFEKFILVISVLILIVERVILPVVLVWDELLRDQPNHKEPFCDDQLASCGKYVCQTPSGCKLLSLWKTYLNHLFVDQMIRFTI